jgi:hypothetical protein
LTKKDNPDEIVYSDREGKTPFILKGGRLLAFYDKKMISFRKWNSTCAVAHKLNRQYIGIEQLDYIDNDSVED